MKFRVTGGHKGRDEPPLPECVGTKRTIREFAVREWPWKDDPGSGWFENGNGHEDEVDPSGWHTWSRTIETTDWTLELSSIEQLRAILHDTKDVVHLSLDEDDGQYDMKIGG